MELDEELRALVCCTQRALPSRGYRAGSSRVERRESTEAVAVDVGLSSADGVVVDVARNEGPGRVEAKGEEREDAAGAHPDVEADSVLRNTKLAGMRNRALERAG